MIYGKWTECLWGVDPAAYESFRKRERRGDLPSKTQPVRGCSPRGVVPGVGVGDRASGCRHRVLGIRRACAGRLLVRTLRGARVRLRAGCAQALLSAGLGFLGATTSP